uniref:Disease resistance RPP13-like protein 1 n=1 Tax=Glycine max TaxID=3847 RepID=K7MDB7_SOYBN
MAAEMVDGALVSTFVQMTIDSLASRFVDYFRRRKLNKKLLSNLKVKLLAIDVLADDAELKQFRDARVRDWLFKAKDVVFELSKCQVEAESQSIRNKVWNFFKSSSVSSFDKEIESRIEQILGDLDDLESRSGYLGLTRTSGDGVGSGSGRIVDDDKKLIFDWISSDTDEKLSILSIVGMGGLGKTTLAQLVYNDPRMESKFDDKAWICVSEEFNVLNISRAILDSLTDSTETSDQLEIVHTKLIDKLRGNKFFLVLDDVWNESQSKWKAVQNVGSLSRHAQLQEDYCRKLFAKHAFQGGNPQPNPECNEIGMKIVEKCRGLPLALKSMEGLLHNKSFVSDWENILKREIWEIEDADIDYVFDRECLIQLWMTENFLHCHQGSKSPEEVGQLYFNDLLSRSFFQQSSENKEVFVMHYLLNDLTKYVCGDIYFRLGVDGEKSTQKITRHFSVAINNKQCFNGFATSCDTKKLRTFMPTRWRMNEYHYSWNCNMSIHELFSKFKFLRVLCLSHCSDIYELPDSLNYCSYLKDLPSNLHELTNLHHLEVVDTEIIKVPPHLGKLKNLQVSMSSFDVGKTSEFTIQQLGELNLHGRLSFRELPNIENSSDALAADLKNKTRFVELKLKWNLDWNPDDSAKERDAIVIENLQPSKHLEKLSIINYGVNQFPNWLSNNSLSNMVSLELGNCQSCQRLPSLGLFPVLKNLEISSIDGIVSIGADFLGNSSSSFPSLETLKFSSMKAWEKLECEAVTGAFPYLQYLSIRKCPKLKGHLPEQLLPLKKLEISECKQLDASAPRALELDLKDFGNLQLDWVSLKKLRMDGHGMEASFLEKSHTSLEGLKIYCCPKYEMFCDSEISDGCDSLKTFPLDFFPALRILHLNGFRNLHMITQDHTHNHLEHLEFDSCPRVESFPEGGLLSLSLTYLRIHDFRNLKKLDYKGLCQLSSLDELILVNCPNLQQLPEKGLPKSISPLSIVGCPNLNKHCQNPGGEDWSKIAHIQNLDIL